MIFLGFGFSFCEMESVTISFFWIVERGIRISSVVFVWRAV